MPALTPMHPDDGPYVLELRDSLDEAYLALVRWYRDSGLPADESRERAASYMLALFKQATLDIAPDVERITLAQLVRFLGRLTGPGLASVVAFVAAVFSLGFWLGSL